MEEKLIADNMGLVYKQLHRLNLAYDDEAFSFAMEGLMNAARTYDTTKNIQFSTYASVCIYNGIQMLLRKRSSKRQLTVVSYEERAFDDGPRYADVLVGTEDLETNYIRKEQVKATVKAFNNVLDDMKPSLGKTIITMWRDSGFEATQQDIAAAANTSQSYVSRVIKTFQHKVKQELEDYL